MDLLDHIAALSALCLLSGTIGYWIKARGLHGIWNDLYDIKSDIEVLKNKVESGVHNVKAH